MEASRFSKYDKIFALILSVALLVWMSLALLDYLNLLHLNSSSISFGYFINIVTLIHVVQNGTFIRNRWSLIAAIVLLFSLGIGMLAKIQHWPYGAELFSISSAAIAIVYGIHFSLKAKKSFLDVLKLIWVLMMCSNAVLIELNLRETLWFLRHVVWLLLYILYLTFAYQILFEKQSASNTFDKEMD